MAFGDTGNPVAFGKGQHPTDDRSLFLKIAGGEVLTSFYNETIMKGKVRERKIEHGKEAEFVRTGKSMAEYITRGQELLGNPFETGNENITIDGLLVAHHDIWDLDAAMSHFDVRSPITQAMGQALAEVYDSNLMRQIILAARRSAVGPFPAGNTITESNLAISGGTSDGYAWINAFRAAKVALQKKNVRGKRYAAVPPEVFDAIKYGKDANGHYLILNRDFGGTANVAGNVETMEVEGFTVMSSNLIPMTNQSADTSVFSKYRANFSTTVGIAWTADAVGVLELLSVQMELARDARRKSDFLSASQACGAGTLRPECAVEFRTGAPA